MDFVETRVRVDDVELAVRDHGGAGRDVVLVHGGNANLAYFEDFAPSLTARARVVAYDIRGHGKSSQGQLRPDVHADDLIGLVRVAELRQPVVVGASAGAFIAVRAAAMAGDALGGVVTIDGPLVDPDGATWWRDNREAAVDMMLESLKNNPGRAPWRGSESDLEVERMRLREAGQAWLERSFVEVEPGVFERRPDSATAADLIVNGNEPFEDNWRAVTCPALAIVATASPLLFGTPEARQAAARACAERFPNVDVRFIEGGHDLVREQGSLVADAVRAWLDGLH